MSGQLVASQASDYGITIMFDDNDTRRARSRASDVVSAWIVFSVVFAGLLLMSALTPIDRSQTGRTADSESDKRWEAVMQEAPWEAADSGVHREDRLRTP